MTKIAGSGSVSPRHGSADPDPHQNVMDPEHLGGIDVYKIVTFPPFMKLNGLLF
jgi:hypothetical protein